ncbi:MAG: hypothetical protein ACE5K4_05265 [Candidatus Hydrothermarchaeota archaeon]
MWSSIKKTIEWIFILLILFTLIFDILVFTHTEVVDVQPPNLLNVKARSTFIDQEILIQNPKDYPISAVVSVEAPKYWILIGLVSWEPKTLSGVLEIPYFEIIPSGRYYIINIYLQGNNAIKPGETKRFTVQYGIGREI